MRMIILRFHPCRNLRTLEILKPAVRIDNLVAEVIVRYRACGGTRRAGRSAGTRFVIDSGNTHRHQEQESEAKERRTHEVSPARDGIRADYTVILPPLCASQPLTGVYFPNLDCQW